MLRIIKIIVVVLFLDKIKFVWTYPQNLGKNADDLEKSLAKELQNFQSSEDFEEVENFKSNLTQATTDIVDELLNVQRRITLQLEGNHTNEHGKATNSTRSRSKRAFKKEKKRKLKELKRLKKKYLKDLLKLIKSIFSRILGGAADGIKQIGRFGASATQSLANSVASLLPG